MADDGRLVKVAQWVQGDRNVQISQVSGSNIRIILNERSWQLSLEPAVAPVGQKASAARVVRARSGVLPYVDRGGNLTALSDWVAMPEPFALCIIGGRGGSGKTRLSVELCVRTDEQAGWISGLLPHTVDPAGLRDLADIPNPRLVVIDYAETRMEQLEKVLPAMQQAARAEHPVRVLLLVRKAPERSGDWADALRGGSDWLETLLDGATVRVLDDTIPTAGDRDELFHAAATAFTVRADPLRALKGVAKPDLAGEAFGSPLLIVAAAYLAVYSTDDLPSTSHGVLEGLIQHEDKYWKGLAIDVITDEVLRRRTVALATLTGATSESEAAHTLASLPELADAPIERRHQLARWLNGLYSGEQWWNPLEPDLLGEYLISTELSAFPEALSAALRREDPARTIQVLDTFARVAAYDAPFMDILTPVLSCNLASLCSMAAEQAATAELRLNPGFGSTIAGALNRAASIVPIDPEILPEALAALPSRLDVTLGGLTLTLTDQAVKSLRQQASDGTIASKHALAGALNNSSILLAQLGRREEALGPITEAVKIRRELAAADPHTWAPYLPSVLNNMSTRLAYVGQFPEAHSSISQAVKICRKLAKADPDTWNPRLAGTLSNLAKRLNDLGQRKKALARINEAVKILRKVASADPDTWNSELAANLNNLSALSVQVGKQEQALSAITEAEEIYRKLAKANPSAWNPQFAGALTNLSHCLASAGRREEALKFVTQAVAICRGLEAISADAWKHDLAMALSGLGIRFAEVERYEEALGPLIEAETIYRDLAEANSLAWTPDLAGTLINRYKCLSNIGRHDQAQSIREELHGLGYVYAEPADPAITPERGRLSFDQLGRWLRRHF